MKYLGLFVLIFTSFYSFASTHEVSSIYQIKVQDIDGKEVQLSKYKGKILLIVNTASECGFTPQYKGLQKLYEAYKNKGLIILGFPSNDFGGQEPGTDKEIKKFCELQYRITFPMFAKLKIKGDDKSELYRFLQETQPNKAFRKQVKWNFNKFLISREGEVVQYFPSSITPESPEMQVGLEHALRE